MRSVIILGCVLTFCVPATGAPAAEPAAGLSPPRWSKEKANEWYQQRPWIVGCNYIPSTMVNWTEMWQKETFDPKTIDRELGISQSVGFNTVRVFLQFIVWEDDPEGFLKRFERFLQLADKHGIAVMPVFFDDCVIGKVGTEPFLGKQPDPIPGMMFSSWTPSPGHKRGTDRKSWPKFERYIKGVVGRFANDKRVLMWDLYNEVGINGMGDKSLPLLKSSFEWARSVGASQPITACVFGTKSTQRITLEQSDIVTFHSYDDLRRVQGIVQHYKKQGRPVVCTEWLARPRRSLVETHLPFFQREKVGAFNWGLVNGRSQTQFAWGTKRGTPEPKVWFHDLFHRDGTPYRQEEVELIRKLAIQSRAAVE